MQALSDAALYFGWIKEFSNNVFIIELGAPKQVKQGEFMFFEVSGANSMVSFVGYVMSENQGQIRVQVTSDLEEKALKSESRIRISTIEGVIVQNGKSFPIKVDNISENGMGFESDEFELKAGEGLATLYSPEGTITLKVVVRHVRTDREALSRRGGALIENMDRVSRARWTRLFME